MFYDRYAQLCTQRGISKSAAAGEAGLSKSLVTKWKNSKTAIPSPEVLAKLSAYFHIPVSELLGEEEKEQPTANYDGLSDVKKEFIQVILGLSDEKVQMLLQVAKSIK